MTWKTWLLVGCMVGLIAGNPALADPDICTVSVLNQTAHVQADGTWTVPNVPANMGSLRARVNCVGNGITTSGTSPFFAVMANQTSSIQTVALGNGIKTPVSLSLSAPGSEINSVGGSLQTHAAATFADGSTTDVTPAESGTIYTSTNAGIASVDLNGEVTAHTSGKVLVMALHEAILASVEVSVVLGGDSDGDGIPDDWEIAHGLNPNDEFDALEDLDGDGLSNLAEYQQGTDPSNPDTDGDGLSDGDEVNRFHTNSLLADSDGDGLRDGLEVRTGSDPLDPNSFNLGAALASVTMNPGHVRIVFNTVFGEASRQLQVIGQLIDGTTLDVTSRRFGTSYASTDLTIANFGAEEGRVYAGQNGEATVTASVSGHSGSAGVAVSTFSPRPLSFLALSGFANGVAVSGNYAFVATGATGLQVVDVADLNHPVLVAAVDTPGNANDVRVVGSYAYVADGITGVLVVDVTNPLAPRIVGEESTAGNATDLVVLAGKAYVAEEAGLSIVDVSDSQHPIFLGTVSLPGRARGVDVVDNLAVIAASSAGVFVVDVTDPQNPAILGQTATRPDGSSNAADVAIRERLAYVADGAQAALGGLRVIDFRDPTNPAVVGSSGDAFGLTSVALDRGIVLASDYFFTNAVPIFGADAGTAQLRDLLDFSPFRDDAGQNLAVQDGVVFLAGTACCSTTRDNGTTGASALFIGRYAVSEEDDTTPPTVSLTAPQPGATVGERTLLTIRSSAQDDGVVDSVQFKVNGRAVFTDYTPPYEYPFAVPAGGGPTFTVEAVATDFAGNQATASPVTVGVIPNSVPTVALLAPVAGQKAIRGSFLTLAAQASDDHGVSRVQFFVNGTAVGASATTPYRFNYLVPAGAISLSLTAVAYDDVGPSETAGPVVVPAGVDAPPVAAVLAPHDGFQVVEGAAFDVIAGAVDDVGVRRVSFLVNGVVKMTLQTPPYKWTAFAPAAGETLRLSVIVEDTLFHDTTSEEVVVTVIPDPLTTIQGRVIDPGGTPLPGARIEVGGSFVLSGQDGVFALQGLPTNSGDLSVTASAVVNGFVFEGRLGEPVMPLPGGVVQVGDIVLTPDFPGTTIVGQVVDDGGSPLAGATVKVYNNERVFVTSTGADGRFGVGSVPADKTLTVSASATVGGIRLRGVISVPPQGETTTDAGVVIVEPVDEVEDPGTRVIGAVFDSWTNQPVAGARVNVFTSFDVFSTATAPDGTFAISGVPTVDGSLFAAASAVIDGLLRKGSSAGASGEAGGTTDLGSFYLYQGGGGQVLLTLPDFLAPRAWHQALGGQRDGPICPAIPLANAAIFGGL